MTKKQRRNAALAIKKKRGGKDSKKSKVRVNKSNGAIVQIAENRKAGSQEC
jgi:hypothetical protein